MASLTDFQPLLPAERLLLKSSTEGRPAIVGEQRPPAATAGNTVRAEFVRFLALGGDVSTPVHERGIELRGAWVAGSLDLQGSRVMLNLLLKHCCFERPLVLRDLHLAGTISLLGSQAPGIRGDRFACDGTLLLRDLKLDGPMTLRSAQIAGDLDLEGAELIAAKDVSLTFERAQIGGGAFLRKGFKATGGIRLLGARIDGDLDLGGATLEGNGITALAGDRATLGGSLFMSGGFRAIGGVRFPSIKLGGSLHGVKGHIVAPPDGPALVIDLASIAGSVLLSDQFRADGAVRLRGAQIGGDLKLTGARLASAEGGSLQADRASLGGALFVDRLQAPLTNVSLTGTRVSALVDDEKAWGSGLDLDGFTYAAFAGSSPTNAGARIAWLDKERAASGSPGQAVMKPQPWRHLQKVLRDMGHTEEARQVAIALEERLRRRRMIGQTPADWHPLRRAWYAGTIRALHWLFGLFIGYGYRPLRLGIWMACVWLATAALYWFAALSGVIGPSNPLVFQNPAYANCHANWYLCDALPPEYTGFSPLAYSLDLLLPFVNLQQETDWAPLIPTPTTPWYLELFGRWGLNHIVRVAVWLEILFGWAASLLLAAVVSGLAKRQGE